MQASADKKENSDPECQLPCVTSVLKAVPCRLAQTTEPGLSLQQRAKLEPTQLTRSPAESKLAHSEVTFRKKEKKPLEKAICHHCPPYQTSPVRKVSREAGTRPGRVGITSSGQAPGMAFASPRHLHSPPRSPRFLHLPTGRSDSASLHASLLGTTSRSICPGSFSQQNAPALSLLPARPK